MRLSVCDSHGVRQCALQGLEIMQVEILSGKELTNPPEVSFELLLVIAVAKCKQRDSRDSYCVTQGLRHEKHPIKKVI